MTWFVQKTWNCGTLNRRSLRAGLERTATCSAAAETLKLVIGAEEVHSGNDLRDDFAVDLARQAIVAPDKFFTPPDVPSAPF
jgi:hypothetical protein